MDLGCADRPGIETLGSRVDGALDKNFLTFCSMVACGHASDLLVWQVLPLALMLCAVRLMQLSKLTES